MNESLLSKINFSGLSYREYYELIKKEIEPIDSSKLMVEQKKRYEDTKLNLHRMTRIEKYYSVSEELKNIILRVDKPQTWMIISETWCGDSAQIIPYIAKMLELNSRFDLKIILRDVNPDIMDLYLTNGTRSIPILVAFDQNGAELFRWGPRPQEAKDLFANLKSQGLDKSVILEKLHLWYGRNRGKNLENEIKEAIQIFLLSEKGREFYLI